MSSGECTPKAASRKSIPLIRAPQKEGAAPKKKNRFLTGAARSSGERFLIGAAGGHGPGVNSWLNPRGRRRMHR